MYECFVWQVLAPTIWLRVLPHGIIRLELRTTQLSKLRSHTETRGSFEFTHAVRLYVMMTHWKKFSGDTLPRCEWMQFIKYKQSSIILYVLQVHAFINFRFVIISFT